LLRSSEAGTQRQKKNRADDQEKPAKPRFSQVRQVMAVRAVC